MTTPRQSGVSYAKIHATLPWHRKLHAISDDLRLAALGYYVATVAYCENYRTDGRVEDFQLQAVAPCSTEERTRLVNALVEANLFDRSASGVVVHDYLDWNRSKADIEAGREAMSKGGRRGGKASGAARRTQPSKPTLEGSPEKRRDSREEDSSVQCTWCRGDNPNCPDCGGTGRREAG